MMQHRGIDSHRSITLIAAADARSRTYPFVWKGATIHIVVRAHQAAGA